MTSDNLPVFAIAFGGIAVGLILAALVIIGRRWWRERAARLQLLADPTVCVECGEPWHHPCPYGQWRNEL